MHHFFEMCAKCVNKLTLLNALNLKIIEYEQNRLINCCFFFFLERTVACVCLSVIVSYGQQCITAA